MEKAQQFIVIVPAAGVGKRMKADCPKQYLCINNETILSHTVMKLLSHPAISKIVLAVGIDDQYFAESILAQHNDIIRVNGGVERVDSVLSGLKVVDKHEYPWVLVHDAARPCISHKDIDKLIDECLAHNSGGILAAPVRDTMKRGIRLNAELNKVDSTVDREQLWHALTPQMFKTGELTLAIEEAIANELQITDEASAMEQAKLPSLLVHGSSENIKITHPDDLALAEFYINKEAKNR
ncbi:MAG: 2-C-methyl-D-erythritol 4-phosphate cytidylyltransferase [Colwellia sp.]|nr:2-C-methyl-D-erythritol 4-phosphate cytidylyltransferase [Colwellia sp.]